MTENEIGCDNCYYTYFDERAYPCSLCIRGIERTDMWQPSKKTKADRKTEPTWEQVKEYCNKRCLDIVDSAMRKQWYKDEPQTEDGIMPEVKAEVRLDENNKTLWIKTDTIESFDRVITEDGSNWCRIFYEDCGECAHNKPRSNDEPQTERSE